MESSSSVYLLKVPWKFARPWANWLKYTPKNLQQKHVFFFNIRWPLCNQRAHRPPCLGCRNNAGFLIFDAFLMVTKRQGGTGATRCHAMTGLLEKEVRKPNLKQNTSLHIDLYFFMPYPSLISQVYYYHLRHEQDAERKHDSIRVSEDRDFRNQSNHMFRILFIRITAPQPSHGGALLCGALLHCALESGQ